MRYIYWFYGVKFIAAGTGSNESEALASIRWSDNLLNPTNPDEPKIETARNDGLLRIMSQPIAEMKNVRMTFDQGVVGLPEDVIGSITLWHGDDCVDNFLLRGGKKEDVFEQIIDYARTHNYLIIDATEVFQRWWAR